MAGNSQQTALSRSESGAWVEIVDLEDVARVVAAWDDLAANALEPNVFYESWQLLPALKSLFDPQDLDRNLVLAFVWIEDADRRRVVIGFMPFCRAKCYRGWPVRILRALTHPMAFLTMPLVRKGYAHQVWESILTWAEKGEVAASLIEMELLAWDGPVQWALVDVLNEWGLLADTVQLRSRAILVAKGIDGAAYQKRVMSSYTLRKLRQKQSGLEKLGRLSIKTLEKAEPIDQWIQKFLALEASGWKGKTGTAIDTDPRQAEFFQQICHGAQDRNRLKLTALLLGDTPIAIVCGFRAGDGDFLFKITYDETYSRFSPGVLLQLANIIDVHKDPTVTWQDSCAGPDHPMFNRIWGERRVIGHVLIAPGNAAGRILTEIGRAHV